jgi:Mitochondrial carrier protein
MVYSIEEVSFDQIDKRKFLLYCGVYSFIDALIFHPFSVSSVVAELHRTSLPVKPIASPSSENSSFYKNLKRSLRNNLSIREAAKIIIEKNAAASSQQASGYSRILGPTLRGIYCGFPITFAGLIFYDVMQMLPYNYIKSGIEQRVSPDVVPAPIIAGLLVNMITSPISNVPWVLFRQQVQQKCLGKPSSLNHVIFHRIPKMEGSYRVLFRGVLVSLVTGVPFAAIGWQVYETTKLRLQKYFDSHSVYTSIGSGCISGAVGVFASRPIGVVVARMQTDTQSHSFWSTAKTIYKLEGPGAFYKGLMARLLSNAPRAGIFFAVYQTLITWSKIDKNP